VYHRFSIVAILFWFDVLKIIIFVFINISHWIIICDIGISDNLETILLGIRTLNFRDVWCVISQHLMYVLGFRF
jgi:hypothetical protein